LQLRIVNKIPVILLLVRTDFQQNNIANYRVINLRIVERLVFVRHRLGINTAPVFGVILNLDGEVAVDGFHKNLILDADVRVFAAALHVARGALPGKLVLRRKHVFVVAAVVDVRERITLQQPLKRLDIVRAFAHPKHHK
jgi:hypothetical protein